MATKKATIKTGDYDYATTKIRDKSGKLRHSTGNGDAVAKAMLLHVAAGGTAKQAADANGLKIKDGGNAGTYRMALGVALRGLVRNGTPVKIGTVTVKMLSQRVALPKVSKAA